MALTFMIAACRPSRRGWRWPWIWYWHWHWHWNWKWRRSLRNAGFTAFLAILTGFAAGAGDDLRPAGPETAAQAIARGQNAYALAHWEDALAAFETAVRLAPESAVARYDTAATLFQLGRYAEARQLYHDARERADDVLRTKIDFALGNTALADGDVPHAIRAYDDCVASKARGAAVEAVRRDARVNRQFALEQPQSLAIPQDNDSDDPSKSPKPDRSKSQKSRGSDSPKEPGNEPENTSEKGEPNQGRQGDSPRPRQGRIGGAGGGTTKSREPRGDTPDDRLDEALEHIRDAQKRRLPEEEPPMSAHDDRKDW